jgi:hypothetical protein
MISKKHFNIDASYLNSKFYANDWIALINGHGIMFSKSSLVGKSLE